ncbi:MFS transporter [Pelomyxa schiedti]|nr:MFS transporter [Pelomyxa schiedti]
MEPYGLKNASASAPTASHSRFIVMGLFTVRDIPSHTPRIHGPTIPGDAADHPAIINVHEPPRRAGHPASGGPPRRRRAVPAAVGRGACISTSRRHPLRPRGVPTAPRGDGNGKGNGQGPGEGQVQGQGNAGEKETERGGGGAAPPPTATATATTMKLNTAHVMVLACLNVLMMSQELMLVSATPEIANEWGLEYVGWVQSGFMMSGVVTVPVLVQLGRQFGNKNVMIGTLIFYFISTVAAGFSPNIFFLIVCRFLQGGCAGMACVALSDAREYGPPGSDAIVFSMGGTGIAVGLILGGILVSVMDWHYLFFVVAFCILIPLGLLLISLLPKCEKVMPLSNVKKEAHIDWLGCLQLGISSLFLMLSITEGDVWGWSSVSTIFGFLLSACLCWSFAIWELGREYQNKAVLLSMVVLLGPSMMVISAIGTLSALSSNAFYQLMPFFIEAPPGSPTNGLGIEEAWKAGLLMSIVPLEYIVFGFVVAKLSKRKTWVVLMLALGALALGVLFLLFMPVCTVWLTAVLEAFLGAAFVFASIPAVSALGHFVPEKYYPAAMSFLQCVRFFGQALGPILINAVMDQNSVEVVSTTGSCSNGSGSSASSCADNTEIWPTTRGFRIMWGMLACTAFLDFGVALLFFFFPHRAIPEFSSVPPPAQPLISSSNWANPFRRHTRRSLTTLAPCSADTLMTEPPADATLIVSFDNSPRAYFVPQVTPDGGITSCCANMTGEVIAYIKQTDSLVTVLSRSHNYLGEVSNKPYIATDNIGLRAFMATFKEDSIFLETSQYEPLGSVMLSTGDVIAADSGQLLCQISSAGKPNWLLILSYLCLIDPALIHNQP